MERETPVTHRRNFLARLIRNRFVWICMPFVIGGGTCLAVSLRLFWLDLQYNNDSRKTQGIIVEKLQRSSGRGSIGGTTSMGSGPSGSVVTYVLRYQYRTITGDTTKDEDNVNRSYWEKSRPEDFITVYYLPKVHGHSRLWTGMRPSVYVILFLIGAPMTFMGLLVEFLIVKEIQTKRMRRRQFGFIAQATEQRG